MSGRVRIAGLYVLFAVMATVCNLAVQRAVLALGDNAAGFGLALVCGTGVGLVVKYLLDKRWIFADRDTSAAAHGRQFSLYALMGVLTTLIFWGTETAFWWVGRSELMREIGAVIGLSVGYVVKYRLDRRFVFRRATATRGVHRP